MGKDELMIAALAQEAERSTYEAVAERALQAMMLINKWTTGPGIDVPVKGDAIGGFYAFVDGGENVDGRIFAIPDIIDEIEGRVVDAYGLDEAGGMYAFSSDDDAEAHTAKIASMADDELGSHEADEGFLYEDDGA